jgi:16S rRNA processing protein RimM
MIKKEDIFPIGQINKPHGINGEMAFSFTSDVFDSEDVSYFIIERQGIFVPFFIEEYRFKSNETALVKFEGISSDEKARSFSGLTVYLPKQYLEKVENTEIELDYFVGFTLIDAQLGEIGIISEIDQTTENALFVIPTADDELLIPVGDDYIQEIDHENKRITVDLPIGLLEL